MTTNIQEFDYSVNMLQSILWQYNNAENLVGLIAAKENWYQTNQQQFWTDWYNDVFNLATANDFGCAVWGYILGLSLSFDTAPIITQPTWGFGPYNQNFENGNFAPTGGPINLTTAQKRIILQLRYFQLVTSGTVPEVNRFLAYLFGPGQAYLLDAQNMTQRYVFKFALDRNLLQVIQQYDLLPRPAGVGSEIVISLNVPWGFGPFNENFENGNFYN